MSWRIKKNKNLPRIYDIYNEDDFYGHILSGELPVSTLITAYRFYWENVPRLETLYGFIAFEGHGVFMVEFHNRQFHDITHYPQYNNVISISYNDDIKVFTLHGSNKTIAKFQETDCSEAGMTFFRDITHKNSQYYSSDDEEDE